MFPSVVWEVFLPLFEVGNAEILSWLHRRYRSDGKEKEAFLEEDDDLWVRVRHRHIAVVLEYVSTLTVEWFSACRVCTGLTRFSHTHREIPKLMKEISSTKKATEGKVRAFQSDNKVHLKFF